MPTAMVVLAHPDPASFNHAVAGAIGSGLVTAGFDVGLHDLYGEGFDPLVRAGETDTLRPPEQILSAATDEVLRAHRRELAAASMLAVAHPNWWGKPPAMMAGWIDRVLVPGVAYALDDPAGVPTTLLRLRSLYVVNTSDTTAEREAALFGDPLQSIWRNCIGSYLGEALFERRVLRTVTDSTIAQREEWLGLVQADAHRIGLLSAEPSRLS